MTDYTWNASKDHPTHAALAGVLEEAFAQSATGKGQERHGHGAKLESQPIMLLPHLLDSVDGLSYQVMKKIQEATKMFKAGKVDAAEREFLGAIVYSACGILFMRSRKPEHDPLADERDTVHEETQEERDHAADSVAHAMQGVDIDREPLRYWLNKAVGLPPGDVGPAVEEPKTAFAFPEMIADQMKDLPPDTELSVDVAASATMPTLSSITRAVTTSAKAHGATTAEEVREYWNLRHEWRSWLPSGHTYKPGITLAELRTFHDRYARDDAGPDSVRAYIAGFAVPKDD